MKEKFGFKGEFINLELTEIDYTDLEFWKENPRYRETIEMHFGDLANDISQSDMLSYYMDRKINPTTYQTLQDIIRDGMINERIFVQFNPDSKKFTIFEGNRRFAIMLHIHTKLRDKYPNFHTKMKAYVYPEELDRKTIEYHVGVMHVKGKVKWESYNENGMFYRELDQLIKDGFSVNDSIKSVAKKYEITTAELSRVYKAFSFLEKHNLRGKERGYKKYVYFKEYANSKTIQKVAKEINDASSKKYDVETENHDEMDRWYIQHVHRKDCPKAVDVREFLIEICNAAENGNSILLKSLIEDNRPLKEVVKEIDSGREDVTNFFNKIYLKIQSNTLNSQKINEELEKSAQFRERFQKIWNYIGLHIDPNSQLTEIRSTTGTFTVKNPEKEATVAQCRLLATVMDQLPAKPSSINWKRLIAYFSEQRKQEKLNMGQVKEYMEFVEKNKEIPGDIIEAIENYNAEKR